MNIDTINIDTIRLNALANPKFIFSYSIISDGKVKLTEPAKAICNDLRHAIDFARCKINEVPFCIKCKNTLNEENMTIEGPNSKKFYCPKCETCFKF